MKLKNKPGHSKIVPTIKGETAEERHHRRMLMAVLLENEAKREIELLKLYLVVSVDGKKWNVYRDEIKIIEWYPLSGIFKSYLKNFNMKFHDVKGFLNGVRFALNNEKLNK